ncbi:hypothetical protein KAU39_04845 [bacterium]|nr:hypothetical protein [bacterium]
MKTLVLFYSMTGKTGKIANEIAVKLNSDIEEIFDKKNRNGIFGHLAAGKDAVLKKFTEIEEVKKDLSQYDLVIIGTPVWAHGMTPAIRTYLSKNKFNKLAFFCTQGHTGEKRTFREMEEMTKQPVAVLSLMKKEIKNNQYQEKVREFCDKLKQQE